jgi:DeoR/GlpR family transcriptional regulator of sugar metabolism
MMPPDDGAKGRDSLSRRSQISELVRANGSMRIEHLAEQFGVSTMTIHRDLTHLDQQGVLRKVRSGAEARPSEAFEHSLRHREQLHVAEKSAIAAAAIAWAAERVDMQAVALDDSTTCLQLLPLLRTRLPLHVITNFLPVVNELATEPEARLTVIGGEYIPDFAAFGGPAAVKALADLHCDVAFMSVPAVARAMCFHSSRSEAETKRAFMASAELCVLMVDHHKLTRRAVHRVSSLLDFDAVVVDAGIDEEELHALREDGVQVVVAPLGASRPGPKAHP